MARLAEHELLAVQRLKLIIAYDGRPFAGWQSQARRDGIQDHLEAAFKKITGAHVRVHGSGRTDSGVHALGQVAHADVPRGKHTPARWLAALNANLPFEVRVIGVTLVPGGRVPGGRDGFHARYNATGKRYDYRIWNAPWQHPLEIGRAWHVPRELDFEAMRKAAAKLIGRHDFAAFAANRGEEEPDTIRTLHDIQLRRRGALLTLRFEGDGFLYKMVRMLTGTLIRIGESKAPVELIDDLLRSSRPRKTNFAAPAEGLYLTRVFYRKMPARRNAKP